MIIYSIKTENKLTNQLHVASSGPAGAVTRILLGALHGADNVHDATPLTLMLVHPPTGAHVTAAPLIK